MSASSPVIAHLREVGITVISRWIFNCYVIHDAGDGRPMVVDLGLPSHLPHVAAVLEREGSHPADLVAAVATHGHADHVGGLPDLRALANTPTYLPAALAGLLDGSIERRSPGPRQVAQILPVMADQPADLRAVGELQEVAKTIGYDARSAKLPFSPTGWVGEGDAIPGASGWQVLHAPGHVADASCLYHEASRTLLSGDSILTVGGRGWFTPEYVDADRSAATEDRLRDLPVDHLLPGHGRPIVGGRDLLGRAISHLDRPARSSKLRAAFAIARSAATHRHHHR